MFHIPSSAEISNPGISEGQAYRQANKLCWEIPVQSWFTHFPPSTHRSNFCKNYQSVHALNHVIVLMPMKWFELQLFAISREAMSYL